jgi:hypothetical protein
MVGAGVPLHAAEHAPVPQLTLAPWQASAPQAMSHGPSVQFI